MWPNKILFCCKRLRRQILIVLRNCISNKFNVSIYEFISIFRSVCLNHNVIGSLQQFGDFFFVHRPRIVPRLDVGASENGKHHTWHYVDGSTDRKYVVPFVDSVLQSIYLLVRYQRKLFKNHLRRLS